MIGTTIANYQVKSLLGEGGMGSVYAVEHPILHRKAAIKVLRRDLSSDKTLVQRFINKARAAAAIHHRNIIDIMDVGTLPDGVPYMLMEYLEGENLGARIRRNKRIPVGEAVEFAYQAADALAAAHIKGIVHRDLKPENLYLIPDPMVPGRELVKVLDFGIAKLRGEWAGDSVKTGTGSIIGTPPYMAPEQCRGLHDEIDPRTDIYSLGIILFEMVCGETPFISQGWGDVLMMHMIEPPPVPSSKSPGLPVYLDSVILRALAKNKDDRFQDMHAFQRALGEGRAMTVSAMESTDDGVSLPDTDTAPESAAQAVQGSETEQEKGLHQPENRVAAAFERVGPPTTLLLSSGSVPVVADDESQGHVFANGQARKRKLLVAGGAGGLAVAVAVLLLLTSDGSQNSVVGPAASDPAAMTVTEVAQPSTPAPLEPTKTAGTPAELTPIPALAETAPIDEPAVQADEKKEKRTSGHRVPRTARAEAPPRSPPRSATLVRPALAPTIVTNPPKNAVSTNAPIRAGAPVLLQPKSAVTPIPTPAAGGVGTNPAPAAVKTKFKPAPW